VTDAHVERLIRERQSVGRVLLARMLGADRVESAAQDAWVTDTRGKRYFDAGSFSIFLFGHRPGFLLDALSETLTGENAPLSAASVGRKARRSLTEICGVGFEDAILLRTGAEAVEAAMWAATQQTSRSCVAHLSGSFHGKTLGALSITDSIAFKLAIGPLLGGVERLPIETPDHLYQLITQFAPAGVFVEAVQGEGGARELSNEALVAIRRGCTDSGSLMICDEIQCGLGRTGTRFAYEPSQIVPDIVLLGKALGGGVLPVSAVVASRQVIGLIEERFETNDTRLAAVAACAVLGALDTLEVCETAGRLGGDLKATLNDLKNEFDDLIHSNNGRGLLQGIHFRRADIAGEFVKASLDLGLLVTPCFTRPEVVRLTPSVIASRDDFEFFRATLPIAVRRAADA
jgi:putrescine aminotransferase